MGAEQLQKERGEKEQERKQLAKQKQEEDQVRQRRKEEKKRRQEERKLEERKLKNAAKANGHINEDESEATVVEEKLNKPPSSSGLCWKLFCFQFFLLLIGFVAMAVLLGVEFDWNYVEIQAYVKTMAEKNILVMKEKVKELRTTYE